ncbi:MAG: TAT-variant-translocated molybdopterin oxidoreductase [Flavobacteriales bacterium]
MSKVKTYWKGIEEKEQSPSFIEQSKNEFSQDLPVQEFLADENLGESSTNRRDFLKFMGFSVAAATLAACESPVVKSIPYVNKPEEITPGVANWYSSTYWDGNDYGSILVKTREGRPIFVKGNKSFGINKGASTPRMIASVLSLYNGARLQMPMANNSKATWSTVDREIKKGLEAVVAKGGKVRVLSSTTMSPSTDAIINDFIGSLAGADAKVVNYDSISYSGITTANKNSFGTAMVPDYNFDKAEVIVSIAADFLTNWLLATDYMPDYLSNRKPDNDWMSKHFHFESTMTTTGSNSDVRVPIKPSEEGMVAAALLQHISGAAVPGVKVSADILARTKLAADALKAKKGKSLVVAGSNCSGTQTVVNAINNALGNYGTTIDINNPVNIAKGNDAEVEALVKEVEAGQVDALFIYGANPVYTLPNGDKFAAGLKKVPLSVSFSQYADETASNCKFICPDNHYLESWNDFAPKPNHYAVAQPAIRPLYDTAQAQESFLVWSGKASRAGKNSRVIYDYIKSKYTGDWNMLVHNGSVDMPKVAGAGAAFAGDMAAAGSLIADCMKKTGDFEVIMYQKNGIGDGQQAANPWLQELPDPITKVTWDNYITMSRADAEAKGFNILLGERNPASMAAITVNGTTLNLPVFVLPGQKSGTVGIALGYGRGANQENIGDSAYQTQEYGTHITDENGNKQLIGENAFRLTSLKDGELSYSGGATIENLEEEYFLACTQTHHTFMGRTSIVRETTFDVYKAGNKKDYNPAHQLSTHEKGRTVKKDISEFDLWDDHPVENVGHRWGMSIDLSSCIGCGSCIVACHTENNVPVVGKDEIKRGRDMHWLRLDRYFSSAEDEVRADTLAENKKDYSYEKLEIAEENPSVVHIPMMCQHCNHAPCETVCPVAATTHSNEGLNQMTYNRCIGTRYCANNCPYKVRRFNWFNYPTNSRFAHFNPSQFDMGRMVLNPDVTVRSRGVMEKCSMCVQQIQSGKLEAKRAGKTITDGEVQSACASSCPTDAITFGDLNDFKSHKGKGSAVRQGADSDRAYHILEEIGTQPNIYYQVKVRNTDEA